MDTVENKNLTLKHGSRTSTRYTFTRKLDRLLGKFRLVKTSLSLKSLLSSIYCGGSKSIHLIPRIKNKEIHRQNHLKM